MDIAIVQALERLQCSLKMQNLCRRLAHLRIEEDNPSAGYQ